MVTLFLILYSLFFAVLAWRNLKWAVYLVCFTLPAYLIRFQIGGVPTTVLEGEILILFLVWLIKMVKKQEKQENSKSGFFFFSVFLFFLFATVSIFVSPSLRSAAGVWRAYFLEPLLFFVVFINTIRREDLKRVFMFLCFNALMLSCFAVYQKFTGVFISNPFWSAEATRRVTSVFPYPNALALYLAPVVVVMLGVLVMKIQEYKNIKKQEGEVREKQEKQEKSKRGIPFFPLFLLFLFFVASFLAIYWTKSKGALLAILAGLIFYAVFFKGKRKFFLGILIVAIFSFFLFLLFSPNNLASTLKGTSTVAGGDSISTRLDMWSETWQMLKTRPILGAGLAGYQVAVAPFHQKSYIEVYLYPHNIILNFWSEIGLFGLLAFTTIVVWFYRTGFRSLRDKELETRDKKEKQLVPCPLSLVAPLLAALTALLVHGLVDVPYFKNDLSVLFWIIVGAMVILIKKEKNNF